MKWQMRALQELCLRVVSGGTPPTTQPQYYGGDIPWLRTQEVNFSRIAGTEITITEDGLNNSAAKWVPENSVVVAMYGNSAGRVALTGIPLTTNQACCNLVIDSGKADYRFVYYRLLLNYESLKMMSKGAAQNNLNAGQIKEYEIPVPALHTQVRIGQILAEYDDLIENNRRRMTLLEDAARQLYREWFGRLRFPGYEHARFAKGVPNGWVRKSLGDLCSIVRQSVDPTELEPDTPYIGLEHMPRRSISLGDWGSAADVSSSKHRFSAGDILFGKIRPYFHKVGVAFVDGVASSDAIVIRPVDPKLHAFVLMTVSSDSFVAMTAQTMKEGSKMPRADWRQMSAYSTPLPPDGLLNSFSSVVDPIVEQLRTLTFANRRLRAARDLLLPRLMSGEITV